MLLITLRREVILIDLENILLVYKVGSSFSLPISSYSDFSSTKSTIFYLYVGIYSCWSSLISFKPCNSDSNRIILNLSIPNLTSVPEYEMPTLKGFKDLVESQWLNRFEILRILKISYSSLSFWHQSSAWSRHSVTYLKSNWSSIKLRSPF